MRNFSFSILLQKYLKSKVTLVVKLPLFLLNYSAVNTSDETFVLCHTESEVLFVSSGSTRVADVKHLAPWETSGTAADTGNMC